MSNPAGNRAKHRQFAAGLALMLNGVDTARGPMLRAAEAAAHDRLLERAKRGEYADPEKFPPPIFSGPWSEYREPATKLWQAVYGGDHESNPTG